MYLHWFLTSVLDESGQLHAPADLLSSHTEKELPVLIEYDARSASDSVRALWRREKISLPRLGNRTTVFRASSLKPSVCIDFRCPVHFVRTIGNV